jgi:hypothetical protein
MPNFKEVQNNKVNKLVICELKRALYGIKCVLRIFNKHGYVNKQCVFYCGKSKTIHGGTPVQTIMYISITKGLCTLITHINYFL